MKKTKSALLLSAVSMLLCLSMLVGSTFAWFTDTASTGVNKIVAGNLDIDIVDAAGQSLVGQTIEFKTADDRAQEDILWEPGCKYRLEAVKVVNNGNLAFQYKIVISAVNGVNTEVEGATETADLAKVIDVKIGDEVVGTLRELLDSQETAPIIHGVLLPEGKTVPADADANYVKVGSADLGTITLVMQETAGNEYMNQTLDSIAIDVYATQYTYESDSFDNQYDAKAEYDKLKEYEKKGYKTETVTGTTDEEKQDSLNTAISNVATGEDGKTAIALPAGTYTAPTKDMQNKDIAFTGNKDTVVDLSDAQLGHTQAATGANVAFDGVTVKFDDTENYTGLAHTAGVVFKDCTIIGKQTLYADAEFINCTFVNSNDYSVWTWGANNVTFTGCTFESGGKALLVYCDTAAENFTVNVTLNSCVFNDDGTLDTVKAAVETGSNPKSTSTVYNITMNGCTVNGFAINNEGTNTGTTFYGNKNSMDADHLIVVIK